MKLKITVADFAKSITLEPGWRKLTIKEVTREQNAAKTGMNTVVTFEVDNGTLSNGIPDLRQLKNWLPDAYPVNWLPLLSAIYDRTYTIENFEDLEFDPAALLNVQLWGDITREPLLDKNTKKDTGRLQNQIRAFQNIKHSPV